jgi:hypothetical protein
MQRVKQYELEGDCFLPYSAEIYNASNCTSPKLFSMPSRRWYLGTGDFIP